MEVPSAEYEDMFAEEVSSYSFSKSHENIKDEMHVEEISWKGTPISKLCQNINKFQYPPVQPSKSHTVLFMLPFTKGEILKPYPSKHIDVWDKYHVRMPNSFHSLYPLTETELKKRWELIQIAFSQPIVCSQQLEEAILYYNSKYSSRWNFDALHTFFQKTLQEEESEHFFANVLPKIIKLALSLPKLITGSIPLLHQKKTHSISLSQQQISCLLANAFLCTFPRRNSSKRHSEFNTYPDINFNRLFGGNKENNSIQEKLKCLINYFRRVCDKVPDGVVTYSRHYFPDKKCSNWKNESKQLPNLHVSSAGAIEEQGLGFIQMDFANKFVGGGVLSRGCVQEEIRFVICPELIAARLFTECLDDTEVLIVTGIERFSNYKGYSDSFQWAGNYQDNTASDSYNRRYCTVVACDALCFLDANVQYAIPNIVRELNKAYSGFSWGSQDGCNTSIATGNWGCGAFRGDPYLKAFIQLMAAGKAGRDVAYFTFGDVTLRDRLLEIHTLLRNTNINIGQLYELITGYNDVSRSIDLYSYLYNALSKSDPVVDEATWESGFLLENPSGGES